MARVRVTRRRLRALLAHTETTTDGKTAMRVMKLVEATLRDPFGGIGKPEPLRFLGPGVWSRRVTQEHRIVYLVEGGRVDFLQARYHY